MEYTMTYDLSENSPAKMIRTAVFMEEQGFQNEFDQQDHTSWHFVFYQNGEPFGCARIFNTPNNPNRITLGRVAILKEYRGLHLGMDMLSAIEEEVKNPVVVLSGPSHAEEVAFNIPTTVLTSSKNMKVAEEVQDLFMTSTFRVYTNDDLVGVEIGGAVKNIIALAAGVCDGLGYGDNTKAALMTRGMAEIVRIGTKLGGKIETFLGLTGMGDLIVTCTSMHSRNRKAGYLIGTGKTREEAVKEVGMVVEGIKACHAFYNLKEKLNVEMPITDALYKVLFEDKPTALAMQELLERDKVSEYKDMTW